MLTQHDATRIIRRRIRVEFDSQRQASERLGIPYRTLNAMLTGRRSLDRRLCDWMGWQAVTVYRLDPETLARTRV